MFRLPGLFLLRFETRTFLGLLFQDPPRRTGPALPGLAESMIPEELPPQTCCITVFGMRNPGAYPRCDVVQADSSLVKGRLERA